MGLMVPKGEANVEPMFDRGLNLAGGVTFLKNITWCNSQMTVALGDARTENETPPLTPSGVFRRHWGSPYCR
ncbi:hypothetical protein R6Q59_033348 [Mikania micrantha]